MFSRAEAWTRIYAAVYQRQGQPVNAAAIADEMLTEFDKRFRYDNVYGLWFNKNEKAPK